MQLVQESRQVTTSGVQSSMSFGIDESNLVMIYDILRSKLYTNPVLTIVREYSSNARDSHTEAGCPEKPIYLHLPTEVEPYFAVRDFGVGITPSRMEDIFCKYGSSTKRNENTQIGGFGLGSKSAFCYTDTFTISTVYDGIAYHYSAYLDDTKVGAISLLDYEPTEEHNGTTITIPVKRQDIHRFRDEAVNVTRYWQVRPEFNVEVDYPTSAVVLQGETWRMVKEDYYRPARALIADLPLDISLSQLSGLTDKERQIHNTPLLIDFPIGKLSLAVNRESLQYDAATQLALKCALSDILNEAAIAAQERVDSMPSLAAANRFVYRDLPDNLVKMIRLTYKGMPIQNAYTANIWFTTYEMHSWKKRIKKDSSQKIDMTGDQAIVINDTGKKTAFNIQEALTQLNVKKIYYYYLDPELGDTWEQFITDHPELDAERLNAIRWSEVWTPKPKAKRNSKSVSKPKGFITAYKLNNRATGTGSGIYAYTSSAMVDVSADSGVYFTIVGFEKSPNTALEPNLLGYGSASTALLTHCKELLGREVYGIRECNVDKLGEGWRHINDVMNEFIVNHLTQLAQFRGQDVHDLILEFKTLIRNRNKYKGSVSPLNPCAKPGKEDREKLISLLLTGPFLDLMTQMHQLEATHIQYRKDIELALCYTLTPEQATTLAEANELEDLAAACLTKYPLLKFLLDNIHFATIENIAHYVNLIV